jgi:hypothetical protein
VDLIDGPGLRTCMIFSLLHSAVDVSSRREVRCEQNEKFNYIGLSLELRLLLVSTDFSVCALHCIQREVCLIEFTRCSSVDTVYYQGSESFTRSGSLGAI